VTQQILDDIAALKSNYSHLMVDLLTFFKKTYKDVFKFDDPPLHDPLAVAYVICPEIFESQFVRVDIGKLVTKSLNIRNGK
jgi:inosine-uridine nucleoside N-ribohydrolase